MGNHNSVCAQTLHAISVSENESFVKVLRSTNLPFRKIKPTKYKFFNLVPARKKFTSFGGK